MCNFIIRNTVKSYATVDYFEEKDVNDGEQTESIKAGEPVEVVAIHNDDVFVLVNGDKEKPVTVPLNTFVHMFSDKDPNKKEKTDKKS